MIHVVPLLAAAALVSLQIAAGALITTNKLSTDNALKPKVATTRRFFSKYVKITQAPPETVRLAYGQPLVLECQVMGYPSPFANWLRNGEPMDYEEEVNEILPADPKSNGRLTSRLVLDGANDGDVYTCVATSGVNQQTASTTVFVDGGDDTNILIQKLLTPPKPIITTFYNDLFQNQGSTAILLCRVHGKAKLYWTMNDKPVYNTNRVRMLPSGDLLIQELRWADMGLYACVAKNEFGTDVAESFLYPTTP